MNAGSLRQRVTLQAAAPAVWQVRGEAAPGPIALGTVWAAVDGVRYGRGFGTPELDETTETTFVIRYRPDYAQIVRAVWEGRTFEVQAVVDPDGRRRELRLEARELVP